MNVLFVNACVREQSRTLLLERHLLSRLPAQICEIRLEDMDLKPLTKHSLAKRDELLREGKWEDPSLHYARQFADADCIVIAAPYWDLGFPALLKIYLETVTVSGITFCYEESRPRGLCKARKLYYITTAGGRSCRTLASLMCGHWQNVCTELVKQAAFAQRIWTWMGRMLRLSWKRQ